MHFWAKPITPWTISRTGGELPRSPLSHVLFERGSRALRAGCPKQTTLPGRAALKPLRPRWHPLPSPYRSGDTDEPVEADQDDVEDGGGAHQVVHHQPQLTQAPAEPPLARQHVGDVEGDAEAACGQSSAVTRAEPIPAPRRPGTHPPASRRRPGSGRRSFPACGGSGPPRTPEWPGHFPAPWPALAAPWARPAARRCRRGRARPWHRRCRTGWATARLGPWCRGEPAALPGPGARLRHRPRPAQPRRAERGAGRCSPALSFPALPCPAQPNPLAAGGGAVRQNFPGSGVGAGGRGCAPEVQPAGEARGSGLGGSAPAPLPARPQPDSAAPSASPSLSQSVRSRGGGSPGCLSYSRASVRPRGSRGSRMVSVSAIPGGLRSLALRGSILCRALPAAASAFPSRVELTRAHCSAWLLVSTKFAGMRYFWDVSFQNWHWPWSVFKVPCSSEVTEPVLAQKADLFQKPKPRSSEGRARASLSLWHDGWGDLGSTRGTRWPLKELLRLLRCVGFEG